MKIERIDVARLEGIAEPFSLEGLAPGLNVVVGPNASGKSSLCRAVRVTLWPDRKAGARVELTSVWSDGASRMRAQAGDVVQWERDGARCDGPAIPGAHLAHCYTLGLRDLLDATSAGDGELADKLRVHMAGGFDLVAASAGLDKSRQYGKREADAVVDAQRALDLLDGQRKHLADEDDSLADLRARLREAEAAERELTLLRKAQERAVVCEEQSLVRTRLATRPAALAMVRGDELEDWDELARDLQAAADDRDEAAARIATAEEDCRRCRLPDGPVDEGVLRTEMARAAALHDLENELDEARRAAAAAADARGRAQRALGRGADTEGLRELDDTAVDALDEWVADSVELAAERRALEARLELAPEAQPDDLDVLHAAAGRLRDWLSAAGESPLSRVAESIAARVAAAASALLGAALAVWLHPAWSALSAASLGIAGTAWWAIRAAGRERSRIAERYAEQGAAAPARWVAADVRERLGIIETELRHCERARELAAEREGIEVQLASKRASEAKLEERRLEIVERIGVDPGARPLRASDWATRLRTWRHAVAAEDAARFQVAMLEREVARRVGPLQAFFEEVGASSVAAAPGEGRAPAMRAALEALRDRCEAWRRTDERLETARRERLAHQRRTRECEARRAALLRRLDMATDDVERVRPQLAALLTELPDFQADTERERQLASRDVELAAALADRADLLALDADGLADQSGAAEARAAARSEIARAIGGIEARVREASDGNARERAAAEVAEAEGALEERFDELIAAAAERFLLDDVEADHETVARPEVLRRAAATFGTFTHHHFELDLSRGDDGGDRATRFRAIDTRSGRMHELDELSDGTRMQLLLAVRLAFATAAEAGTPLPLFLDEALTATDPQRFRAVAESLLTLVESGRQVFYLTCDPADVAQWREVARQAGAAEPHVVDLAAVRRGSRAELSGGGSLHVEPLPPIPSPDGVEPEAYAAELGVVAPDPTQPNEALHLFHVLRGDLSLLHRLLAEARIETLGHWRALTKTGQWERVVDEPSRARIDALADLADAALDAWRIGRGRPVDKRLLAEAGVSGATLEKLSSLAADLGGDAQRLVGIVTNGGDARVKGMRHEKRAALRTRLLELGALDPERRLDAAHLRIRALGQIEPALAVGAVDRSEAGDRIDELLALLAQTAG